jgi:HlyD family secretion protein
LEQTLLYTTETLYHRNKVRGFSLYIVVLLAVTAAIALLPVIKVDISTQARGVVRSVSENVPIVAVVSGRVVFINLSNNQNIQKGDTLLTVATTPLDVQSQTNANLRSDLSAVLADLSSITSGNAAGLQTAEMQREYQTYVRRREELRASKAQAQRVYNRNKTLFNQGVIPKAEMEKYGYDLQTAQTQLSTLEQQQYAAWQTQKREIMQQIKNYNGAIDQIEADKKNYIITAPVSGNITNFSGIQKGAFLNASQSIAEISASDGLLTEVYVSPNNIGLLKIGQTANFQIDTYNYNQWGMLTGKITDIDKNLTLNSDGTAFFKVRCLPDKNYLQLKNGYQGQVSKGMTLTARFIINRRSLWNLLYDKVDDWVNPKTIRN